MPPNDYVRIKDRVPRNGKGPENLLIQLGQYLRLQENKFVQKIVVDADRAYIYFEKMVRKDQAPPDTDMTWHDAVRSVAMEELEITGDVAGSGLVVIHDRLVVIHDLFRTITQNGYEAAQVLIGKKSTLFTWINLPRATERLFGVPIQRIPEIPDDTVILCGSRSRDCDPEDIEFSVKVAIPV